MGEITIESLQAKIAELESLNSEATEAMKDLAAENAELKKSLEALAAKPAEAAAPAEPSIPKDPVSVNGKKYQFTHPSFIVPGLGKVTALEAIADKEKYEKLGGKTILEHLAASGSSVLTEVA